MRNLKVGNSGNALERQEIFLSIWQAGVNWFRIIILILSFFNFQKLVNPSFSKTYPFSILLYKVLLSQNLWEEYLNPPTEAWLRKMDSLSILHLKLNSFVDVN